jgi:hypothetical protein
VEAILRHEVVEELGRDDRQGRDGDGQAGVRCRRKTSIEHVPDEQQSRGLAAEAALTDTGELLRTGEKRATLIGLIGLIGG